MLGDVADVMWELAMLCREALFAWVMASPSFARLSLPHIAPTL
jgi:hypothetical protein